jgi:hypothetical protein
VPNVASEAGDEDEYIAQRFNDLKTGRRTWADALGWESMVAPQGDKCVFCGARADLMQVCLVPQRMAVNENCSECPGLLSAANRVPCCQTCQSIKAGRGLYRAFSELFPERNDFQELIPEVVEKSYLRSIYNCHECAGTLNAGDLDGDGELTLLDIDHVVEQYAR